MMEMTQASINTLNSLLVGEMTAADTYEEAVKKLSGSSLQSTLEEIRICHVQRAQALEMEVARLGGKPKESAGIWGAFAVAFENVAATIGEKQAIDALEAGEDKGLKDYRKSLPRLDPESRSLVELELLPRQLENYARMSDLKHTLH